MAETKFTKHIKLNLADILNVWLENEGWQLQAVPECTVRAHGSWNKIDVAIIDPEDKSRIVGIEIEVKSNPTHILTNRRKFKEWVVASKYRSGGLMHIIFSEANISQKQMYRLLRDAYKSVSDGNGFFYEFMAIDDVDYRESKEIARWLVEESWEFDVRLLALMYEVFGE